MRPKMIVIAGPPGSGKSTLYPVASFGVAHFNADDRAAELNGGSYVGISRQLRERVSSEFRAFVLDCIAKRLSFAIETTLRSQVTFEQARLAKSAGFTVEMRYLALRSFSLHLERVKARADAGGHSASEAVLKLAYEASLNNLARAVHEVDTLWVYDNTAIDATHPVVLEAHGGEIHFLAADVPAWLVRALGMA
jgi:predicted ABC-type ATPase